MKGGINIIYFDNAATSLHKPDCVIKAVTEAMQTLGNPGRGVHGASLAASRCVYSARRTIAKLFNAENTSDIAFMSNATEALNTVLFGLFKPGDHIISTVCEHNSVLRPLYILELQGVEVDYISADKNGVLRYDEAEQLIKKNTKAFVITHASNVTGNITNLSFFSDLKKKYDLLLIVDGAQTAGIIPVNVRESKIDVYCFTGHKGLMAPQGTGGVYVSPNVKIRPLKSGGSGIRSYEKLHPDKMPDALEAGTLNCHGIAGLKAAVDYINDISINNIQAYEMKLARKFYEEIRIIDNVKIYGDFSNDNRVPIVSLNVGDYDSGYISDLLYTEYSIAVRPGAHCAPMMHKALETVDTGAVRFSFGMSNTMEEVNTAVSVIKEISEI